MVRDSDPEPPLSRWGDEDLLEELPTALRHVAMGEWNLPEDRKALEKLSRVKEIAGLLRARGVSPIDRLEKLTEETGWRMVPFYEECLAYPGQRPWIRDKDDGIRRLLRCSMCGKREHPEGDPSWLGSLCDACLGDVRSAIERRSPIPGLLLFRTYNPDARCPHAGPETVLAAPYVDYEESLLQGSCGRCVDEALERRRRS